MHNSEHYNDPTASMAMNRVVPKSKYYSTPAYTAPAKSNAPGVFVSKGKLAAISDLEMDELKKHLKSCAKSHGDPLECISCKGGCAFGERAKQLLDDMTKAPDATKERLLAASAKGAQATMNSAIMEYQNALNSGDPIQYIISHSKSKADPVSKKYQATAKLKRWEKAYGGLVVKQEFHEQEREQDHEKEMPHLMQMPCLSKKVAAERAAKEEESNVASDIGQVLSAKIEILRKSVDEITKQIDDLMSKREMIEEKINAMITTAECLNIAI